MTTIEYINKTYWNNAGHCQNRATAKDKMSTVDGLKTQLDERISDKIFFFVPSTPSENKPWEKLTILAHKIERTLM